MKKKLVIRIYSLSLVLLVSSCNWGRRMSPNQPGNLSDMGGPNISASYEKADLDYVIINGNGVAARSGMSNNMPSVGNLSNGERVKTLGKTNGWYVVQLPNNQVGMVPSENTKPAPSTTNTQAIPNVPGDVANNLPSEESKMIELVNAQRSKSGLQPLKSNNDLTKIARLKSKDIVAKNYFSHMSPTYGSPFEMLKKFGVSYLSAGENLAKNSTIDGAFKELMNSETHKKNILNPDFTEIGIGVAQQNGNMKVYTQTFIGR